jgi:hypothetical protein
MIIERKLPPQLKLRLSQWLPYLAAAAVLAGLSLLTYYLTSAPAPAPATSLSKVDPAQIAALQNTWGIDVTNVGMTANGGLVDMRIQVIDPDKALGILNDDNYPVLIDEASGVPLFRPTGHGGHTGNFNAGRTYYFLYQNVNGLVKSGSRITIHVGEVTLEHVLVR